MNNNKSNKRIRAPKHTSGRKESRHKKEKN